ncbi:XRE family transcriptional regulator [Zunongwangia sp. HRR-M8]|uniref:XRE family transcriptional regulator n=1 Tax=Zunongwangia sp. HRR-M8 TaxID=3015170 RepID=UPI0022DD9C6F|nr:XRE family transcriptional regulator [Zunongwangia sp. HRR-M8]WBL22323.1 XRE family transcriptional regulator [Zunongwangia sp. HRR-M8]
MAELTQENIILANKIATRIKQLREEKTGPVQMDFVRKYNVEKQIISRWESHIKINTKTGAKSGRGITIYSVEEFCKIIGIKLVDFFDDDLFQ